MNELTPTMLVGRLQALHSDVSAADPEGQCAWPLARVFNALLAETRELLNEDPIVTTIGSIKLAEKSTTLGAGFNSTVRVLTGQLIAALEGTAAAAQSPSDA